MIKQARRDAHRGAEIVLIVEAEMEGHAQHTRLKIHFLLIESEILELLPKVVKPLLVVVAFQSPVNFLQK